MPFPLEKPHPVLLPARPKYPPRSHTRSPSRASPSRARITDDLLSDLSPDTTLAAFTSSSSPSSIKLRTSIESASPGEREFGIRAATAANKIKEWVSELEDWPWPESGSAGFEAPISKRRKLSTPEQLRTLNRDPKADGTGQPGHEGQIPAGVEDGLYCGSLYIQDVIKYSTRIDEILDDMDDLDVGGIKSHILDLHVPGRSRPTSSASAAPVPISSLYSYQKMDDFTAVITATVLQALPYLARLQILMDVWGIRLVLLRQIKPLLDALEDAEVAVRSGWRALDLSDKNKTIGSDGNDHHIADEHQRLSRDTFNTMQNVLQSKVALVGQKLDRMLDSLEGRQDTLPETWLDRMDLLERRYADWVALANKKVLEGEWEKWKSSPKDSRDYTGKSNPETPEISCSSTKIDEGAQASQISTLNSGPDGIEVHVPSIEQADFVERHSIAGGVSVVPRDNPSLLSQLDGGKEIPEDPAQTEPITPQTPTTVVPRPFGDDAETIFPSTPPSSKSSSAAKISPRTDQQRNAVSSYTKDFSKMANVGYGRGNEPESAEAGVTTDGTSKRMNDPSSAEPQSSVELSDKTESEAEARPSHTAVRKHSDVHLAAGAPEKSTSTSPATPPNNILDKKDTIDTRKALLDPSETRSDCSPLPSVKSTGSSYASPDSSPSASRIPSSHYTRRALSPIQSSADWFDFEDVKTPTKGALREDPNVSNLLSPKHDGQKTPTSKETLGTPRKMKPAREDLDDEQRNNGGGNSDDSDRGTKNSSIRAANKASTPDPKGHPILSFDEASPEGALPPLPPMLKQRKSLHLLDSPEFPSPIQIPETPLEPPMLPNVDLLEAPSLFSPTKGSADQLQQQISEILESLPTRIRLTTETERNPFPDLKIPKKRPALKKTASASSLRLPSRSPTPTPTFTLAPAYGKNSPRPRHQNANPEIKLYHLSRSNGGAPIKLFVRLVGENGERVMVRVGGGWADLGEYLREYAIHHSRRNAPEDKIHIHDSSSRIVSSSSISSARNGRSSPVSRSVSSMDGPISRPATSMDRRTSSQNERPLSSLATRKNRNPRKSVGEDARQAQYRSPSTPMPAMNPKVTPKQDTPPSATSVGSRASSRSSFNGEDSYLGLSGPRSKQIELSEESEKWVESMTEKVKQASAEKEKKQMALLGELGKAGSTKRLFRKN